MTAILFHLPIAAASGCHRRRASILEQSPASRMVAPSVCRIYSARMISRFPINFDDQSRGALTLAVRANSEDQDTTQMEAEEDSNSVDGPPPLTIIAGVFVFLLVSLALGSSAIWLISLVANLLFSD